MMQNADLIRFDSIRGQLMDLGLFNADSLVMFRSAHKQVVLDASGNIVHTKFFDEVQAELSVLTSGRYSAEYAVKGDTISAANDDMAQMFGACVRCTEKPNGKSAAFVIRNKGFVVTARFESELIAACILMEKMCMTSLLSPKLGGMKRLGKLLCGLEHTVYLKKYSQNAAKAADEPKPDCESFRTDVPDFDARKLVITYGKLLVKNRLIQATWGNISIRIDDDRFLVTPSGVDYDRIRPEDVVEVSVSDGSYAAGLHPSSERKLHQMVYQERPDIRAIIHTHSAYCQVYSSCRQGLSVEAEHYPCAEYSVSGSKKLAKNVAKIMKNHNGCIMANHGFVIGDKTLEQALARIMTAEGEAQRLLETN